MDAAAASHAGRCHVLLGGTSGMGHAAARELGRDGARLALIGRSQSRAVSAAQALATETGAHVIGIGTDHAPIAEAIRQAHAELGAVHGLAVTAGPIAATGALLDLADSDWEESFETQLMTVVRACRAAIPLMRAGGEGRIVTMAAYSIRAQKAFLPHYTAMKSAVVSLTKNIAKFHGADAITANCIAPGAIDTEALDDAATEAMALHGGTRAEALGAFMVDRWGMRVALGRIGRAHEVGELIAFLLSPRAGYLTGALINMDGGTDF